MNFQDFSNIINFEHITFFQVFMRFFAACFSGFVISGIYKLYHLKDQSSREMIHTLIFMSIIIASAMMIIGNNLASAFGLVGAVSIIRFRTVVKSARDMSFVLFAVVAGMSCGLGYLMLALSGLLFIGVIMIAVYYIPAKKTKNGLSWYRIKISYRGSYSEKSELETVLKEQCLTNEFYSMKIEEDHVMYSYTISLADHSLIVQVISALESMARLEKLKVQIANLETLSK